MLAFISRHQNLLWNVIHLYLLPQYCSQLNPANIALSTVYLRTSKFRVQVYCLNINALTQWTGHLHLWDRQMSDTWFITLQCLLSLYIVYIYIYSWIWWWEGLCSSSWPPDCIYILRLLQCCTSLWLVWSLRLEKAQCCSLELIAYVTSLAANLSSMARSHKITWSQVLWIHKSTCLTKIQNVSGKVFSDHRICISLLDHETVALVSLSIRSWKWRWKYNIHSRHTIIHTSYTLVLTCYNCNISI